MAPRDGGTRTPIEAGLIQRAVQGVRYIVRGVAPDGWFGPSQPIAPVAQDAAEGRAFDFPAGYNLTIQPRAGEAVTFAQLRALADAYDLIRLCIETRKDQLARLEWTIKRRDGTAADARADALREMFREPDREHDYETWQRMLVEDLLVLDAPAIYVRPTRGGGVYALEAIDGATIKRVLDDRGRTPVPPDPAYQQVLKGVPAADYTREELVYAPRNVRTHKVYGFSPVEQIIVLVNLALRREVHQLNYYTEGNVPQALASVPASWTPEQIQKFQTTWDALIEGDLAAKRRIKFIPDGTKYIPTQTEKLFDEGDEWLARVVTFCFGLPPTPFVKQVNRATAGTAQEVALEEGLAPIMKWWKRLMDRLLAGPLAAPSYEFAWADQSDVDPEAQAKIDDLNIKNRSKTINEVRAARGDEPVAWGDQPPAAGAPIEDPSPIAITPETSPAANADGTAAAAAAKRDPRRGLRRGPL